MTDTASTPEPAPDDNADAQWLAALAGQPDALADARLNQQAAALRQALQQRSRQLDEAVPAADAALWQQLQFRLRREGLLKQPPRWQRLPAWGLAATVALAAGLGLQLGGSAGGWFGGWLGGWFGGGPGGDSGADVLRGGPGLQLRVSQPEARLAELLAGLQAAGAKPTVSRPGGGRILLQVAASEAVLDYLASQRIEPPRADGLVTLLLVPLSDRP